MPLVPTLLLDTLKSRSCSPQVQVYPCAATQQCYLRELSRIVRSAKIPDSAFLQYYQIYATEENFLKPELSTVFSQLVVLL